MIVGTKDGEVSVKIYDEKRFLKEERKLSSDQRIIFIGNGKLAKERRIHFKPVYNKYGMVFSCLGKRGSLYVDHVVPFKEYNDFINLAKQIQDDVRKVVIGKDDVVHVAAGAAVGAGVELGTFAVGTAVTLATGVFLPLVAIVGGAAVLGGGGVGVAKYNAKKNEIMRQQYDCLILKCYLDYLNDFMK